MTKTIYQEGDTVTALVTRPRGCWKWQKAYGIAKCRATRARSGKLIWKTIGYVVNKASEPQLRGVRRDFDHAIHNQPCNV